MDDIEYTNVGSRYFQHIADVETVDVGDDLLLTHQRQLKPRGKKRGR
uniref:Uncharacterized protein n=1 Tax=Cucumis melo TaxID=3656 RepID=A0A9I9EM77_CUCME